MSGVHFYRTCMRNVGMSRPDTVLWGTQCMSNPVPIGVGYLAQYIVKPLLGYLIAKVRSLLRAQYLNCFSDVKLSRQPATFLCSIAKPEAK